MALTPYNSANNWLIRPRSADPYVDNDWFPSTYPPALRSRYGDASNEFLAGLWPAVSASGLDEDMLVEDWVYSCPDLNRDYNNSLTRQEVMEAFMNMIELARYADRNRLQTDVAHDLLADLESAMRYDQAGLFQHKRITIETQRLFRALSYVSYCFRSTALGRVLHSFFTQHIQWIVRNNCRRALWQWCRAIMDSAMDNVLKHDCVSRLHKHRPDIFILDNIRDAGSSVRELSHLVRWLIDLIQEDYPSRRLQIQPSRHDLRHRPRWPIRDGSPAYQFDREEREDRLKLRDELQYHENEADHSRRQLARMDSDYGSPYAVKRPKSYGQRRPLLKDAWSTSNLWSGSDDD